MSELDSAVFKRTLFRAIVLQPLVLAALAGLLLWQIDRVLAALGWVAPPSPVVEQVHKVRELLVNMEYGLVGYTQSGDDELADRAVEAADAAGAAFRELEDRVALRGLVPEEDAIARMTAGFASWQRAASHLLRTQQSTPIDHPARLAAASSMEAMKGGIVSLLEAEAIIRDEHLAERREAVRLAIALALLVTLLIGLGIAFSAGRRLLALSRSYSVAINDQRARTDAIRAAQQQAEAANRAKDDFLATVSHELRSPLNAILTASQLLKISGVDPETTRKALELIDRNVKRQARLVEDLLEVSRIVSGKLTLDPRGIDLTPIVKEATQGIRQAAEAGGLEIELSLPEEPVQVWGDHDRLLQILSNVVANAVKFTPEGGRISVSLEASRTHAEIVVSDTGVGIAAHVLPKIFDRFEQADSSKTRKHGGLGLGLAIARHLVTLHHGTIEADSAGPNRGATFRIRLPLLTTEPALAVESVEREPEAAPSSLGDVHVLVVEDDEDARETLTMLLAKQGANVVSASSVAQALTSLVTFPAEVVLTDVAMPEADGYDLLRRLRAEDARRGGHLPVIAVTAMASAGDRARLRRAGFDHFVTKPIDPRELLSAVATLARSPDEARRIAARFNGASDTSDL